MAPGSPTTGGKIWHEANCHCGAIRYRVLCLPLSPPSKEEAVDAKSDGSAGGDSDTEHLKLQQRVNNCNCSSCTKKGYLNVLVPRSGIMVKVPSATTSETLELNPGTKDCDGSAWAAETLSSYVYNHQQHVFCKLCGCGVWIDGEGQDGAEARSEKDILGVNVSFP